MRNIIDVDQLADKTLLHRLFRRADAFRDMPPSDYPKPLQHLTICTIFFEPSTRTRLSFETAIQNLGGQLITVENAGDYSSAKKGESLEDTIKTIQEYANGIVIRHPEIGSAERAAKVSRVPIINAGDGAAQHPTQALLDLYTIHQAKGAIDGLKVVLVGDTLNSRTIHSLAKLLSLYKVEILLLAPPALRIPQEYLDLFQKLAIPFSLHETWDEVIEVADVVYINRVQKERFKSMEEYEAVKDSCILTLALVQRMKTDAIIMDPLPRVNEIELAVDDDPRAIYFQQVRNGLYTRMALLEYVFAS